MTLLCWEETPEKCHRRLIVELIAIMSENKIEALVR